MPSYLKSTAIALIVICIMMALSMIINVISVRRDTCIDISSYKEKIDHPEIGGDYYYGESGCINVNENRARIIDVKAYKTIGKIIDSYNLESNKL